MRLFRKRKGSTIETLEKFVSPGWVSKLMEEIESGKLPTNEVKHFQFVIVHIDESDPKRIPYITGKVIDAFPPDCLVFYERLSSLMVAYLGIIKADTDSAELRVKLVNGLLANQGTKIRVAHGHCQGLAGMIGSGDWLTHSAVIPSFSVILRKLFETDFGTAIEIEVDVRRPT